MVSDQGLWIEEQGWCCSHHWRCGQPKGRSGHRPQGRVPQAVRGGFQGPFSGISPCRQAGRAFIRKEGWPTWQRQGMDTGRCSLMFNVLHFRIGNERAMFRQFIAGFVLLRFWQAVKGLQPVVHWVFKKTIWVLGAKIEEFEYWEFYVIFYLKKTCDSLSFWQNLPVFFLERVFFYVFPLLPTKIFWFNAKCRVQPNNLVFGF